MTEPNPENVMLFPALTLHDHQHASDTLLADGYLALRFSEDQHGRLMVEVEPMAGRV